VRERERKTNKKYYSARVLPQQPLSLSVAKKRKKKKNRERERREKTTRARARSKPYFFFFFTQSVRARVLFDLSFHQTNTKKKKKKKIVKRKNKNTFSFSNNKKEKEITWCDDRFVADCLSLSLSFSSVSLFFLSLWREEREQNRCRGRIDVRFFLRAALCSRFSNSSCHLIEIRTE
jgi:hypothetical protein